MVGGPPPLPLLRTGWLTWRLWELEFGEAQIQDYPALSVLHGVTLQLELFQLTWLEEQLLSLLAKHLLCLLGSCIPLPGSSHLAFGSSGEGFLLTLQGLIPIPHLSEGP